MENCAYKGVINACVNMQAILRANAHFEQDYRVTRMVAEKIMLTSYSKFRHRPG